MTDTIHSGVSGAVLCAEVGGGLRGAAEPGRVVERLLAGVEAWGGRVIAIGSRSVAAVFGGEDAARRAVAAAWRAGELAGERTRLRAGVAAGAVRLTAIGGAAGALVLVGGEAARRAGQLAERAEPGAIAVDHAVAAALAGRVADCAGLRVVAEAPATAPQPSPDPELEAALARLAPLTSRAATPGSEAVAVVSEIADASGDCADTGVALARRLLSCHGRYGAAIAGAELAGGGYRITSLFSSPGRGAERALRAALDAACAVKNLAASTGRALSIRSGVHAGAVARRQAVVTGEAIAVAHVACDHARPFELLVTAGLADLHLAFHTSPAPPLWLAPGREPVAALLVHGRAGGGARTLQRRRGARAAIGAREVQRQLDDRVDAALDGRGGVIGLAGDPGAGKSFLLAPVVDRWVAAGGLALLGRCSPSTRSLPMAPLQSLLFEVFGLVEDDAPERRRREAAAAIDALELGDARDDFLAYLAGDAPPWSRPRGIDAGPIGDPRWERVVDATARILAGSSNLCIIEDLHHADALTRRAIRALRRLSRASRFLLIASYRPHPSLGALRRSLDAEIAIPRLSEHESAELIARQLEVRGVDGELARVLCERGRGNPGRLVELLRFLRARGLLVTENDVARAAAELAGVCELLAPGDALAALERPGEALSAAAGRALDGAPDEVARRAPRRPVAGPAAPARGERRDWHARLADLLAAEANAPARAAAIAHHRRRAGQLSDAALWYERAALAARDRGRDDDAASFAREWEIVARGRAAPARAMEMALCRLAASARGQRAAAAVEEAGALAARHGARLDREQRAELELWRGAALRRAGEHEAARGALLQTLSTSRQERLRCEAAVQLALCAAGDAGEHARWLDRAAAEAGDSHARAERVELTRAWLWIECGRLADARALGDELRRRARRGDRLRAAALATAIVARCELLAGGVEPARVALARARALLELCGSPAEIGAAHRLLGEAELCRGRPRRAQAHLAIAAVMARQLGDRQAELDALAPLGAATALCADVDLGQALAGEGADAAALGTARARAAAALHLLHIAILRADGPALVERLGACAALRGGPWPLFAAQLAALEARARALAGAAPAAPGIS